MTNYDSDYQVRLATLQELGGDVTKKYDSVYEIDLAILDAIQGGGGGGAQIDDTSISTTSVWSSSKVSTELGSKANSSDLANYATTNDISTFITANDASIYAEKTYVDASLNAKANTSYVDSNFAKLSILTQAQYDALVQGGTVDVSTLYIISNS